MSDAYLAGARARAEARMRSRCRVVRRLLVSLDTATLDLTDTDPSDDVVVESACRVRSTSSAVFAQDAEGMALAAQDLVVSLPLAAAGGVRVRDEIHILDGGPNPLLTGRVFRVTGLPADTDATAARFPVEQTA